jgi:hypothetical protein
MRNRLLRSIARLSFKRHRIHVEHQRRSDAIPVLTDRKSLLSEDSLLERVIVAALQYYGARHFVLTGNLTSPLTAYGLRKES